MNKIPTPYELAESQQLANVIPTRINYFQYEFPHTSEKADFSTEFVCGESNYWDGGLRERLIIEHKGKWLATDGSNIVMNLDILSEN
jgi:hypothetical protein